jgi:hypothetical protein
MVSLNLQQLSPIPDQSLSDQTNDRVLKSLARFAMNLERLGYTARISSNASLQKLSEVSQAKKEEVIAHFDSWSDLIEPLDPESPHDIEMNLLRHALNKHGFQADDAFWKTIDKSQIIEIYDENMIQLYRSISFFAITGYSLLDISLFEWYLLWERPRKILEDISAELNEVLQVFTPVKRFKTRKHLVREIFDTPMTEPFIPSASLLEPLYLGSLKSNSIREKKGFICSSTGEKIAIGEEAESIQFI